NGISIDFQDIKSFLREFLPDHCMLNDYLDTRHPTAENLTLYFYREIKKRFSGLRKVVLWESETSAIEYSDL
ncbi:MAG: 6-carboxytetrahydropterin synthase, partial [Spirochaetota bacterium]|nr:6-carboxytetrahydropterin synthase [Spirochaetota bacterium]